MKEGRGWEEEELYFEGDGFFSGIAAAIERAVRSIEIEVYIFENDRFGARVVGLLERAAARGVEVRVLVDGVGSPGWANYFGMRLEEAGVDAAVYHPLPWSGLLRSPLKQTRKYSWRRLFGLMNRRNHRKVFIFDECEAWAGSFNIVDYHLAEFAGEKAWRDSGVRVRGEGITELLHAFNLAFGGGPKKYVERFRAWRKRRRAFRGKYVKLNVTRKARRANYRELLLQIRRARKRVWIETAYFVPRRSLLRALRASARRGVDVRIIVPHVSDVFFMVLVTRAYYAQLLKSGIKIYEYMPTMMHAKTVLIDNWGLVGSTNLNHRSFLHDLEVDILLSKGEAVDQLGERFEIDAAKSELIAADYEKRIPYWQRFLGKILLFFRQWL